MTAAKYANMKTKSTLPGAEPTDGARRSNTAGVNDRTTSTKTSGHRCCLQKEAELVAYFEWSAGVGIGRSRGREGNQPSRERQVVADSTHSCEAKGCRQTLRSRHWLLSSARPPCRESYRSPSKVY